jgi:hypothetical protein
VLFKQIGAPTRYAENDIYFANDSIPAGNPLPDSDMLKAIHAYASDFYDSATTNRGQTDWGSLDETALIAMGILLEETAKESLGETGDLAFVEGEEIIPHVDEQSSDTKATGVSSRKKPRSRSRSVFGGEDDGDLKDFRSRPRKQKKRSNHGKAQGSPS